MENLRKHGDSFASALQMTVLCRSEGVKTAFLQPCLGATPGAVHRGTAFIYSEVRLIKQDGISFWLTLITHLQSKKAQQGMIAMILRPYFLCFGIFSLCEASFRKDPHLPARCGSHHVVSFKDWWASAASSLRSSLSHFGIIEDISWSTAAFTHVFTLHADQCTH